jgi:toxin ParE1/3/4
MKNYKIVYAPEFEDQLGGIEAYIEMMSGSEVIAERHTAAVKRYCESMKTAPLRGIQRDDLSPGLRITNFRGSTIISFSVQDDVVWFVGVFFGGQDYEGVCCYRRILSTERMGIAEVYDRNISIPTQTGRLATRAYRHTRCESALQPVITSPAAQPLPE